jgi:hypothetical protein
MQRMAGGIMALANSSGGYQLQRKCGGTAMQ